MKPLNRCKALWRRTFGRLPKGPARTAAAAGAAVAVVALVVAVVLLAAGGDDPAAEMARTVIVCGDDTVDNTELNYYFWNEYFYLVGSFGAYLPDSLDPAQPLDEQMYDEETTWQDYLLTLTLDTVRQTKALAREAEAAGFTLPESYETSLDGILATLSDNAAAAGYTDADGQPDVAAYLVDSYGPGAAVDSLTAYLTDSYLAAAYSDALYAEPTFTDEEIDAYCQQYADDYAAAGLDDTALRTVRVVLIRPEADDDAAWEAARASAETLLATWEAESGSEEDFAALARSHSDGDTAADGGLLEHLAPSDLTGALADWVFDGERAAGDTAVLRSDEGWSAVYYVGQEAGTVLQKAAEADMRWEAYQNAVRAACDACEFQVDYDAVRIASPAGVYGDASAAENLAAG